MVATGAQPPAQRPKSEFALETVSVRGMEAWREQLYKEEAAQERYARRACSAPVRRELTRPVVYDPPTTLTAMLKTLHSKTSCSHAADRLLSQRIAQGRPRVPLPVDVYAPPVHPNATCARAVSAKPVRRKLHMGGGYTICPLAPCNRPAHTAASWAPQHSMARAYDGSMRRASRDAWAANLAHMRAVTPAPTMPKRGMAPWR